MRTNSLRAVFYGAGLLMAASTHAVAQPAPEGICFEIIPAQGEIQPALLLDRCRGRTWQLVRRGGLEFGWRPLWRGGETGRVAARRPRAAEPVTASAPAGSKARCFTFNGRQYCE
jgi:hypothetical protein